MNKIGNLLWKIFSATMVFVCHVDANPASAADEPKIYVPNDPKMTSDFFTSINETPWRTKTQKICRSGEYIAKCGDKEIGINWLYGMTTPENDLYSYNASDEENMNNLHKFFTGKEPILYMQSNGTEETIEPGGDNGYIHLRNQILSNFCTNSQGKLDLSDITCKKCPNNAMVKVSNVQDDSYDSRGTGKLLWDSWNVHTIADCYMKEFEDAYGTYVYVPSGANPSTQTGGYCYYSTAKYGDKLID